MNHVADSHPQTLPASGSGNGVEPNEPGSALGRTSYTSSFSSLALSLVFLPFTARLISCDNPMAALPFAPASSGKQLPVGAHNQRQTQTHDTPEGS
jgi:hypothetical protein